MKSIKIPRRALATMILVAVWLALPGALAEEHRTPDTPQRVVEGLDFPVDLEFGGDGYLYVPLLQEHQVLRADVETGGLDEEFVLAFDDVDSESGTETGLFSIALHPEFHKNGVLYASYSTKTDDGEWENVLSRATLRDETGAAQEEVLLTRPGHEFHNGGRVIVADGHLWWTTGDAVHYMDDPEKARVAQEEGKLRGKVLRLTLDGEPAPGNPWGDHAYTKGHRNVFGIAWDVDGERAFVTENGNGRVDYVYELEPGENYGWPDCEGRCYGEHDFPDPIWQTGNHSTIAPTGATWFRDALWYGSHNQGDLHRLTEQDGGWEHEVVHHDTGADGLPPSILGVQTGPDATSIWFTTLSAVYRMGFADHADHPSREALAEPPYWWELDEEDRGVDPGPDDDSSASAPPAGAIPVALAIAALVLLQRRRHSSVQAASDARR